MMAKKDVPETVDEKVFTVPLRQAWLGSSRASRTAKSVGAVRSFVSRHMRPDNINISQKLNSALWGSGAKKPLSRIRVKVTLDTSGLARVRLPEEITLEEEKKQFLEKAKKEEEARKAGKPEEAKEEKPEAGAETKKEEAKPEEKEEGKTKAPAGTMPEKK
jgi:ribosomal protein L31E